MNLNIQAWWKNNDGPAVHDLSRLEERMLGMEAEKDSLQLQVILGGLCPCDTSVYR